MPLQLPSITGTQSKQTLISYSNHNLSKQTIPIHSSVIIDIQSRGRTDTSQSSLDNNYDTRNNVDPSNNHYGSYPNKPQLSKIERYNKNQIIFENGSDSNINNIQKYLPHSPKKVSNQLIISQAQSGKQLQLKNQIQMPKFDIRVPYGRSANA